jgi:thiosulfate/3-mercaptopyruvate sulfurtransferase
MNFFKSPAARTYLAEVFIVVFTACTAYFLLGSDAISAGHAPRSASPVVSAAPAALAPPSSSADSVSAANSVAATTAISVPADQPPDPWTASQTVQPADLAKELSDSKAPPSAKPTVVSVGPRVLYEGAHIPGALYHGPGYTAQGIDDLKHWAQSVERGSRIVLYCGCCPLERCPNLRPAFAALEEMGFTNLRVLLIPHDFRTDWIAQGFPIERSLPQ